MKAVILAAGYATRLYPLTKDFPKPLLPVGSRTMLDHLVDRLSAVALSELILVTNHKFVSFFQAWAKTAAKPVTVLDDGTFSEDDRLGAVGDMAFAVRERNIAEPVLVVAGDNLFDFSIAPFLENFRPPRTAQVGLYEFPKWNLLSKYGIVTLDSAGRITEFLEKPAKAPSNLVAICLYAFSAETLPYLEEYLAGRDPKDAPGNYIRWLMTKTEVHGHRFRGTWLDIGDMDSLEEARTIFGSTPKNSKE